MLKYNDNNILVGYIKQSLSSFNYPDVNVYSSKIIPIKGNFYLKDNFIYYYNETGEWEKKYPYTPNCYIKNLTKVFVNNSFIYDSHTHIWLGKYLRYLRDYRNLNLMSLYNCFVEDNSNISDNYKVYSIPVELFENYSLYIECSGKICIRSTLGRDKSDSLEIEVNKLINITKYSSRFKTPIVIKGLNKYSLEKFKYLKELYLNRKDLKLQIKIPISCKSSIVLLEGIYLNSNDFILSTTPVNVVSSTNYVDSNNVVEGNYFKDMKIKYNHSVNNYEYAEEGKLNNKLISPLELLYINSGVNHPFADRLIEYLLNNAITPLEEIPDNIKRIQKVLKERYMEMKDNKHAQLGMKKYANYGKWEPRLRNTIYDIEVSNNEYGEIKDILGYVDKDVEKQLGNDYDIYSRDDGGNDL